MSSVLYEKRGRVVLISLNRSDQLNALDGELITDLGKAWVDFRDDNDLWVAILTGIGRAFCAGNDLKEMGEMRARGEAPNIKRNFLQPSPIYYEIWKPIIAAINGYAVGGGLWLALSCDLRIASTNSQFGILEAKAGVPVRMSGFIQKFIPAWLAYELILLADTLSAQRAYEVGLVNRLVSPDQLLPEAWSLAEKICENDPLVLRINKEVLQKMKKLHIEETLAFMDQVSAPAVYGEDIKDGIQAFIEKRKPVWKNK